MRGGIAAAAFLTLASAALAADAPTARSLLSGDGTVCYGRHYDEDHMAAHPQQRVREIAIWEADDFAEAPKIDKGFYFRLLVGLDGMQGYLGNTGECRDSETGAACNVECDGGGFDLELKGEDMLLRVRERVWLAQCDAPPEGLEEKDVELGPHSDDTVFRLGRLSDEDCKAALDVAEHGVEGDTDSGE